MLSPPHANYFETSHWTTPVTWSLPRLLIGQSSRGKNLLNLLKSLCVDAVNFDHCCTLNCTPLEKTYQCYYPPETENSTSMQAMLVYIFSSLGQICAKFYAGWSQKWVMLQFLGLHLWLLFGKYLTFTLKRRIFLKLITELLPLILLMLVVKYILRCIVVNSLLLQFTHFFG